MAQASAKLCATFFHCIAESSSEATWRVAMASAVRSVQQILQFSFRWPVMLGLFQICMVCVAQASTIRSDEQFLHLSFRRPTCESLGDNALHCVACRYGFSEAMWRVAMASAINLLNSSLSLRGPVMLRWFRIYMVCGTGLPNVMNSFFLELQKTCDDLLEVALSL